MRLTTRKRLAIIFPPAFIIFLLLVRTMINDSGDQSSNHKDDVDVAYIDDTSKVHFEPITAVVKKKTPQFSKDDLNALPDNVGKDLGEGDVNPVVPVPHWNERKEWKERSGTYPGSLGRAVELTSEDVKLGKESWAINEFNLVASDKVPYDRSLKDFRIPECRGISYDTNNFPTASVIIIFHNEALSTLMRSIHSVVMRTPPRLLHEVIATDDYSDHEHLVDGSLGRRLAAEYSGLVRLVRTPRRMGLIRARIFGGRFAQGEVLVYIDSHCEATAGWIEPLLAPIAADPRTVVCPTIDSIDSNTFSYYHGGGGSAKGSFNWHLLFIWSGFTAEDQRLRTSPAQLIRSPTMAGGLFAINRRWWRYLGEYDSDFDLWGGENLELSFKTWMCGGELYFAPCSHVGHVFRGKHPYKHPGPGPDNAFTHNARRLAEVWLDEYKSVFYASWPGVELIDTGDIEHRLELKRKLNCKNFDWYLNNVIPELYVPDGTYYGDEQLSNPVSGLCLDTLSGSEGAEVGLYPCHGQRGVQHFALTSRLEIVNANSALCLSGSASSIRMLKCHGKGREQRWIHDKGHSGALLRTGGDDSLCLDIGLGKQNSHPTLVSCDKNNPNMLWKFGSYSKEWWKSS